MGRSVLIGNRGEERSITRLEGQAAARSELLLIQCNTMRNVFVLKFLMSARCSLSRVASFLEACSVYVLEQSLHWAMKMIEDCSLGAARSLFLISQFLIRGSV